MYVTQSKILLKRNHLIYNIFHRNIIRVKEKWRFYCLIILITYVKTCIASNCLLCLYIQKVTVYTSYTRVTNEI